MLRIVRLFRGSMDSEPALDYFIANIQLTDPSMVRLYAVHPNISCRLDSALVMVCGIVEVVKRASNT